MRVILHDGRVAEFRCPQPDEHDRTRLRDLFDRASPDSLYFRFFHVVRELSDAQLDQMTRIAAYDAYALVCDTGDAFLGIGNYARCGPTTAEVAFFVDDRMHNRGLGTLLLEHLAEHAWREGFREFVAFVLQDNQRMLRVFRSSGYAVSQHWQEGSLELTLPLIITERQRSLAALREKLATAASLEPFFHPRAVAVVGASRDDERLGHRVLKHLIDGGYQGCVYPVNREAASVLSIRAYPRIADIPEPVDLAFIVVPARELLPVINDAIYAGVRGVMIASSGLGEASPFGKELENAIVAKLRQSGIRLIGPSSMGVVSTGSTVSMNASFAPQFPQPGRLAVASHSGALGIAIMNYADRMGLGISHFVSLGNKPDVSVNDLLQYWEDDPETDAIMLYMESFGNPRKFSQITRRLTRNKPILAVKSARTRHTAPDVALGPLQWDMADAPVEALFRQSGIIRADTLEQLFNVAAILTTQPLPAGARVGIVTNSAAGTMLAEDAIQTVGLELIATLDIGFDHLAAGYRQAIPAVLDRDDIDALMILFVPVNDAETADVLAAIQEAVGGYFESVSTPVPIIANVVLSNPLTNRFLEVGSRMIPVYAFPETALWALARVRDYAHYVSEPVGRTVDLADADVVQAREILREGLKQVDTVRLDRDQILRVFKAMGLTIDKSPGDRGGLSIAMMSDSLFGPILGVKNEHGQTHIRLIPLTDQDAHRLVSTPQWVDVLLRVSRLVEDCPEIRWLSMTAASLTDSGLKVGECLMEVAPPNTTV